MKSPKTGIRGQSFLKKSVISIPVFFTNVTVRDLALNSLPKNFSNVFINILRVYICGPLTNLHHKVGQ